MKNRTTLLAALTFFTIVVLFGNLANAAEQKTIELKFGHWLSPLHSLHLEVYVPWVKEVEERTKGRVKIQIYPAEALGKAKDHAEMVVNGVIDIGLFMPIYTPGRFPMTSILELPLTCSGAKASSLAYYDLILKYFSKEYVGFKFLIGGTNDNYHFLSAKRPIKRLDDIKGMKIRAAGAQHTVFMRALGAAPVNIPAPDIYEGLQRGIVDGTFINYSSLRDFKLSEVVKSATYANLKGSESIIAINQKVWDGLPKDIQEVFEGLSRKYVEIQGIVMDKYAVLSKDIAAKAGCEFYALPAEDLARIPEIAKPQIDAKVSEMEAQGLPGENILADTIQFYQKYSK